MYYYRRDGEGKFIVDTDGGVSGDTMVGAFDIETNAMIVVHFLNGGSGVSYSTVVNVLNERI